MNERQEKAYVVFSMLGFEGILNKINNISLRKVPKPLLEAHLHEEYTHLVLPYHSSRKGITPPKGVEWADNDMQQTVNDLWCVLVLAPGTEYAAVKFASKLIGKPWTS